MQNKIKKAPEAGAIKGDGDLVLSSIGAVPMIWDNFSILRTNCAIL